MNDWIHLVGPEKSVEVFGVRLVGVNLQNGEKVILSILFVCVMILTNKIVTRITRLFQRGFRKERLRFWTRQGIHLTAAIIIFLGLISIWFNDPARLAMVFGLVTAGLSFALQKVVTAVAGYFVILRGRTFNIGDRIRMGGVRGDVIDLGFIQTTIMEMGEPPAVQSDEPGMWVKSRQYTGRIVIVSNARIFDEPVFNYTKSFPYIWEEMHLPVPYSADRRRAEQILIEAAEKFAVSENDLNKEALEDLERSYGVSEGVKPSVFYRLTDNWLEMSVRFVVHDHGIRKTKDAMSRYIISALDEAGIGIASGTYDIVGFPPIRIQGLSPEVAAHVVSSDSH